MLKNENENENVYKDRFFFKHLKKVAWSQTNFHFGSNLKKGRQITPLSTIFLGG
jgi:hypothetical protein